MGQQVFDPRVHLLAVEAKLEGRNGRMADVRMALDTGASCTVIPWQVAEFLGLDPARSRERVRFMTGSGMETAPRLTVKRMTVLGTPISRVQVLCHDLPQRSLVDGLLGLSFLRHCRLAIDFRKGLLTLET